MVAGYVPRWMTGAEALSCLKKTEPDERKCFALLQSAIRDGAVLGRARKKERERLIWTSRGITPEHDFVEKVDGPWRDRYILADPDLIDVAAFGKESELLHEDVVRNFSQVAAAGRETTHSTGREPTLEPAEEHGNGGLPEVRSRTKVRVAAMREAFEAVLARGATPKMIKEAHRLVMSELGNPKGRGYQINAFRRHCAEILARLGL